ncbi:hypothetical protein C8Q78DRAFT_983704 [Trametes maxima]|nr:hypothetical protein C8Q78DRAFT_983704 [Trametes maxima]
MDTLPTTLLRRIFELACTDGGYTGNSLSLTSKAIRDASRTARFHSISLVASPRRLHCFLLLYKRELDRTPAPGTTFCIRHLYVTFPEVRKDRRNRTAYKIPPRSTSPSDAKSHSLTTPQRQYIPCPRERDDLLNSLEFLEAVRMLFRLVAPTLWTLAVQVGFSRHGGLQTHTFEQSFDALRELTLVGIEDTNALFADNVQSTPLFPAVTHLRVSGGLLVQPLARAVGVQIPEVSPVIVHVPGAFDPPTPLSHHPRGCIVLYDTC